MQLSLIRFLLISIILSVCVGLFGSALSKSVSIDPEIKRLGLVGIARDGWMEGQAQLDLSKYDSGISDLIFTFNAWRPRGQKPAKLSFIGCNKELAGYLVTAASSSFSLKLPQDCKPDAINIVTSNPFKSSDGRMLGVRLSEIKLKYDLKYILKFDSIAVVAIFALMFLFVSLYLLRLPAACLLTATSFFSLLGLYSMKFLAWDNQWQLLCLYICLSLFSLGLNSKFTSQIRHNNFNFDSISSSGLRAILAIIFVLGAALRFYGSDFGLPNHYHPDEPRKASIALRMALLGDFDPDYFLHPTLLLYLTALYGKIGQLLGFFPELNNAAMNLSGRLVSATAGSLSILVLFFTARCLFNFRVGLLASACLAFAPLSVTCSRYLKEDSLLTLFVLLVTLICVRAVKRDRPRDLLLAGFVAGLATSSKYSGMLSCVAIFLTPWLKSRSYLPDGRFLLWGALSAIFVPVGFIIASPYVVLNFSKFSNHFSAEEEHMRTGHHKVIISGWSQYWMYHLSRSIIPAVTWPIAVLAIVGFGSFLRVAGMNGLYVFALFLAFYLPAESVNAKPPPQPERYILPCIPFVALSAAFVVDYLRKIGFKRFSLVLSILILIAPFYRSFGLASELKTDTRVLMGEWIIQNIPKGSKIVVDAQAYSAFLPQDIFVIDPMVSIAERRAMTYESFKSAGINYILLTNSSYDRYFLTRSADQLIRSRFEDVFDKWVLVKEFKSNFGNYGFSNPDLSLYKVELK